MARDQLLDPAPDLASVPIVAVEPGGLAAALQPLPQSARVWAEASGFKAAAGSILLVPGEGGSLGSVLFGLGKPGAPERTPLAAGKLATGLPPGAYRLAAGFDDPELAALAFALGCYRFRRYQKDEDQERPRLVIPDGVDAAELRRTVAAVKLARDLINTPTNDLGPADLAAAIREIAGAHGAATTEIRGDDLLSNNLPLIYAVGAAAGHGREPRLVDLRWGDAAHPRLTLIGKGVCFDTGGLDIKPSSNMLLMKKDMGGAANALALAAMIMGAGLPVRLRLLVPAVENSISGDAFRPGDVLRSRKGVTVEIGNTDAEGRLILADALTLAAEDHPDLMVDFATLTGAARVALGPDLPAVFTDDEVLAADLARHAMAVADPVWRLPLWAPYRAMIDSKIADINNAGSGGFAGAITAALFLQRFVGEGIRWLHADLFAWNQTARPAGPEGGEAQVIRGLYRLIKERYGAPR